MEVVSARLKGRRRIVAQLAFDLAAWAQANDDVEAVAVVGSWARGTAGMASDVDIVILTDRFEQLAEDPTWFSWLRPGSELIRAKAWGPLLERRFRLRAGMHVELGLVPPSWAELPLEPGTRRVLADGHEVIFDRHERLSEAGKAARSVGTA
jgi:predicted nucleotidyltransferase